MHFEIVHEFDISLDALELAVLSPGLVEKLGPRLANLGHVTQTSHELAGGVLERVWSYKAGVKLPGFARRHVTPEMLTWDEVSRYQLRTHSSAWTIRPHARPEWSKYFYASGTYELVPAGDGHTRRVVRGELELRVPVMRQVAERMILGEVKKTFEAEAATLRDLATLV